jgi:uncharacterized membrane protein
MDYKRFVVAVILSFIVMFALSVAWNALVMGDLAREYGPSIMRDVPMTQWVVIGYLILSLLLTVAYAQSRVSGPRVLRGLKVGVLVGLLWSLPFGLVLHGVAEYPLLLVIVNSAWALVEVGAGGIIVSVAMGE